MRHAFLSAILLLAPAYPQTPAFEVASIKPAPRPTVEDILAREAHIGTRIDANFVDMGAVSLSQLILQAYRVMSYQVTGPDWMTANTFDVRAKIPEGGTREQVPEMLQSLLAERFKLVVHHETKELPIYALIVAKGGPKLKPAASGASPTFRMSGGQNGNFRLQTVTTLDLLASALRTYVDRPIVNLTGIEGVYDMALDILRDPPNPNGARDPGELGQPFIDAMSQLGLKLESRKGPVEMIVVDHAEKNPTAN